MKRDNDRQTAIILSIVGIVPVIWLSLLIAPSISGGLPEIAANLATLFDNPFSIKLCGDSLKTVLILLLCFLTRLLTSITLLSSFYSQGNTFFNYRFPIL